MKGRQPKLSTHRDTNQHTLTTIYVEFNAQILKIVFAKKYFMLPFLLPVLESVRDLHICNCKYLCNLQITSCLVESILSLLTTPAKHCFLVPGRVSLQHRREDGTGPDRQEARPGPSRRIPEVVVLHLRQGRERRTHGHREFHRV